MAAIRKAVQEKVPARGNWTALDHTALSNAFNFIRDDRLRNEDVANSLFFPINTKGNANHYYGFNSPLGYSLSNSTCRPARQHRPHLATLDVDNSIFAEASNVVGLIAERRR